MPELVDQLADLTALRDRESLDDALLKTINDLLILESAAIYRVVGEGENQRWLTCSQIHSGEIISARTSAWPELNSLPLLAAHPLRMQAHTSRRTVQTSATPYFTAFPLSGGADCNGVLEIGANTPLSEESQRLVSGVLRLYLNFQGLLDYGERDALTELLNRKTFDGAFLKATIEQNLSVIGNQDDRRDVATAGSYWLAMIDIDHFKRVNDNFGHLIGDEVLLLLARLMRSSFRFYDQLYRFGGEEFVVLMRCEEEVDAIRVLDRLRVNTEEYKFPQVGTITISIGFSEVKIGDTPSGAIERADKSLYHAKSHGRNQVCSYAALVANGDLVEQASNVGDMELF
jgi:diguanylate cyclase (GGDEF)-like protein